MIEVSVKSRWVRTYGEAQQDKGGKRSKFCDSEYVGDDLSVLQAKSVADR